jgi:hypothetical protein
MIIINNLENSDYLEIKKSYCYDLEIKINFSKYVNEWKDLMELLNEAKLGKINIINVNNTQFNFIKLALISTLSNNKDENPKSNDSGSNKTINNSKNSISQKIKNKIRAFSEPSYIFI